MLTGLRLMNFRCFEDHFIELQQKTLLVGKNNAGKSTCVEALRLVSLVSERLQSLSLRSPPEWTNLPLRARGVEPSLKNIDLHRSSLFHDYGDPPALVSATFDSNSHLDIHIGPEFSIHAVVYDARNRTANTRDKINGAAIPIVSILPQIGPLGENEERLSQEYVRTNLQTARASLHFRNQLHLYPEAFAAFKRNVEDSWPGLQLQPLQIPPLSQKGAPLGLIVRDGAFSAEVAWMGHGLQMWLQTMWFLTRNRESSVLILDEPDVYMHADLQRRLVRMLLRDSRQFIIATHSPEMLAEVEPESVVVLDRSKRASRAATSSKAVQELLRRVGSVHNISLARLAIQRRILFVEGDDIGILKRFQNVVDRRTERPIDTIPNTDIGGWSGWSAVLTLARFFRENAPDEMRIFCVLDRDYHTDS